MHILLANPSVRLALRGDHESRRAWSNRKIASDLQALGVSPERELAASLMLSGPISRAGKLLAKGKISAQAAERLSLAITLRATTDVINTRK